MIQLFEIQESAQKEKYRSEQSTIYSSEKLEMISVDTLQNHKAESVQKFSFLKILHCRTNETTGLGATFTQIAFLVYGLPIIQNIVTDNYRNSDWWSFNYEIKKDLTSSNGISRVNLGIIQGSAKNIG